MVLIGYGNDLRGDDAAGRIVAERIRAHGAVAVEVHSVHQLTPELAAVVAKAGRAVFVDAYVAAEGDVVQTVRVGEDLTDQRLGHVGSPGFILDLARRLYGSETDAWLVTVPAVRFDYGSALSRTTRKGVDDAVDLILALLEGPRDPTEEDTAACTR